MKGDLEALRAFFRRAPFMVDLGIEPVDCSAGRVVTRVTIENKHLQHTGQVHAGVSAAMADHSMGAAAQTMAPVGFLILTAEFKTNLLRAGQGEALECIASVIKPGRQLMFTEAEVYALSGGERKLVATASATMAVVKA